MKKLRYNGLTGVVTGLASASPTIYHTKTADYAWTHGTTKGFYARTCPTTRVCERVPANATATQSSKTATEFYTGTCPATLVVLN